MTTKIDNFQDWSGLINRLNQHSEADSATTTKSTRAPEGPNPPRAGKISSLPQRAAPKTGDSTQVKEGMDRLSQTKVIFSIEVLLALLFDLANNQRRAQRESRMADASIAQDMGKAAAEDIRNEAIMGMTGSVLGATAQIGGAAAVIGGGIKTARSGNVMEVSNKMMTYQASSQTFSSMGQVTKGGFDYQGKQDEAQKALHDASATQAKSIEDSDSEDAKDEAQLVQAIIQLQQQQEESRHEAVRATA